MACALHNCFRGYVAVGLRNTPIMQDMRYANTRECTAYRLHEFTAYREQSLPILFLILSEFLLRFVLICRKAAAVRYLSFYLIRLKYVVDVLKPWTTIEWAKIKLVFLIQIYSLGRARSAMKSYTIFSTKF